MASGGCAGQHIINISGNSLSLSPPRAPPKRHGCLNTEHVTMKMKWDKEIYVTRTDVRSQILPVITSFFFVFGYSTLPWPNANVTVYRRFAFAFVRNLNANNKQLNNLNHCCCAIVVHAESDACSVK